MMRSSSSFGASRYTIRSAPTATSSFFCALDMVLGVDSRSQGVCDLSLHWSFCDLHDFSRVTLQHSRMTMQVEQKSVVDGLIKLTVRSVLFSDQNDTQRLPPSQPKSKSIDATSQSSNQAATCETILKNTRPSLPFVIGRHHAHVMSYACWSDEQLIKEKRMLKRYVLRAKSASPQKHEEPEENDEDYDVLNEVAEVMEAYSLLKLFLSERAYTKNQAAGSVSGDISMPLLHAQLLLYAKYFEATHKRKILREGDVLPIRQMYRYFLHQKKSNNSSSAKSNT